MLENLDRFESIKPDDMSKSAEFWSSPLGEKFSWAKGGDYRKIMTCNHVDLHNPEIFLVSLARPNKVDCLTCGFKRVSRENREHPFRCDACKEDGISVFEVVSYQAGVFIITGKVCRDCYDKQPVQEDIEPKEEVQDEADNDQ